MTYPDSTLSEAHLHSSKHRAEIEASEVCGCFYCLETFPPAVIDRWLEGEGTALCPECTIDSVIGSKSGYPVSAPEFLHAMQKYWF